MKNFIAESFNSWKSYDRAGNLQIFADSSGNIGLSGNRLATPGEVRSQFNSVRSYLKSGQNIGLSGGIYNPLGDLYDDDD